MTTTDPDALCKLLALTGAVLMDFDGPVGEAFAGIPAPTIAEQLRVALADSGYPSLPRHVACSDDPFDVLRHAAPQYSARPRLIMSTRF